MPRVGRRRKTNLGLPEGVRERAGRWYYTPPKKRERDRRRKAGLRNSAPLGLAGTLEARKLWAELTGRRDAALVGTVDELLTLFDRESMGTRPNGKPRSEDTVQQYRACLPALRRQFATATYGKTEFEASRGQAIGPADIQSFIRASGSYGRKYLAVLSNAFDYGIVNGRTVYNPCDKVIAPAGNVRTREPLEWEVECLVAMATPVVALILEAKVITGYRISELLRVHRRDMTAEGIRMKVKGGRWETCLWSPGMRAIVAAAEQLPRASRFPAAPLFPHSRGKAYTYSGWNSAWEDLRDDTNEALDAGVIDPDTLGLHLPMQILDLHIHDMRSKVHDDAEDLGREGHEQLGNSERIADLVYARREKRRRPLR